MTVEQFVWAAIAILLMGALVGYLLRLETHHCPPLHVPDVDPLSGQQGEMLMNVPHNHVFPKVPIRSEHGWQSWACTVCGQEYTSRATRIKPEAGII